MRKYIVGLLMMLSVGMGTMYAGAIDTLCIQSPNLLSSDSVRKNTEQYYVWLRTYRGVTDTLPDETRAIFTQTETDTVLYTCQIVSTRVDATNNLMANGDFENNPPTNFTSGYKYAGWDPYQYYNDHGGASNLYTITHDAQYFWKDFYSVKPHGGNYFALFDAGTEGYAWKAETQNNPNLIIEKDSTYLFSYYAAYPNMKANNSPAQLQFVIICTDAGGQQYTYNLGTAHTLGNVTPLNAWELREERWKAPISSSNVMIGVYDKNKSSGGNDFCLDDIMFQKTTTILATVIAEQSWLLVPCDPPCPDPVVYTEEIKTICDTLLPYTWGDLVFTDAGTLYKQDIDDRGCVTAEYPYTLRTIPCLPDPPCPTIQTVRFDTVICSDLLPFEWRGEVFDEPALKSKLVQSSRGCDSIWYEYRLDTTNCGPCIGVEQYAKWKDVIFIPNPDSLFVSYQWFRDNLPISGAIDQFYHDPAGLRGLYHCEMFTFMGEKRYSCPAEFEDLERSADKNPGNTNRQMVARRSYGVGPHLCIIVSVYDDNSVEAFKQWIP